MKTNAEAENCPADKIREYIENLIKQQKEYKEKGQEVPKELQIPSKIVISPENMLFLGNSKLVDFIVPKNEGKEIIFYWNPSDKFPALEVRTKLESDGNYYLTFIREEASSTKEAFEWDVNNQEANDVVLIVSKQSDALEDLIDMDGPEGMSR